MHSRSYWGKHLDNFNQWEVQWCNISMHWRFNHKWVLQAASFWRLKCWQTKNCPVSRKLVNKWYQMCWTTVGCIPRCLLNVNPKWMPWVFTRVCLWGRILTKIASALVGQAMMQATRPRTLVAPLQLGLAFKSIIWNLTWFYFFRNTLEIVSYEVWLILCRP